jgi:hypothetical protein
MELVREVFEEDLQLSTRWASSMSEIPHASIHRILHCGLKKKSIPHSGVSQLARRRLSAQSSSKVR